MRPTLIPVPRLEIIGVRTPLITATDDIIEVLFGSIGHPMCGLEFEDGDILLVAESPLATTEGRLVQLCEVKVSDRAKELSEKYSIDAAKMLSLIHISEPTRLGMISYAVFCLK